MTTPLNHSQQQTPTPVTWTLVLDPVDGEELQLQPQETKEHVSPSSSTKRNGDSKVTIDIDLDAHNDVDIDSVEEGSGVNNIDVSDFQCLPWPPKSPPSPSSLDTKSNRDLLPTASCSSQKSDQNNLQHHTMQQSQHFLPLLWYFSTSSSHELSYKHKGKSKKKKARIPAKKLLYYTKVHS